MTIGVFGIMVSYVGLTIYSSLKIHKSIVLTNRQKTVNIVLNAVCPLIWFFLISPIIFPKDKLITCAEREKLISSQNGSKLDDSAGSSGDSMHL